MSCVLQVCAYICVCVCLNIYIYTHIYNNCAHCITCWQTAFLSPCCCLLMNGILGVSLWTILAFIKRADDVIAGVPPSLTCHPSFRILVDRRSHSRIIQTPGIYISNFRPPCGLRNLMDFPEYTGDICRDSSATPCLRSGFIYTNKWLIYTLNTTICIILFI